MPNSEFYLDADLVSDRDWLLGPCSEADCWSNLPLELDRRGQRRTDENYMTSVPGVFSAGDARRGQSLVVWAIAEGRQAAHHIDHYLMGSTHLPV